MHTVERVKDERGQGLVELAVALPLLLLILVGLVDIGRIYHSTIALSTGVREGAAYAATLSSPDPVGTLQRVCDASGIAAIGSPCPGLSLVDARIGAGGADAVTIVTYDLPLLYGRILGGFAGSGTVRLRASATYPGLAP